jgi:hypothetical protein
VEFRFTSRKAHLAKNEGFGANAPDPSPILLLNQRYVLCGRTCPRRRPPCGRLTLALMLER